MVSQAAYVGRFAPSPTGPLHAGSLATALASYLDARAHNGRWLLRVEDIDPPREVPGASQHIVDQLEAYGLRPDSPVIWQHERVAAYAGALATLSGNAFAYRCRCSRKDIQQRRRAGGLPPPGPGEELVYDGCCRDKRISAGEAHAWRLDTRAPALAWSERYSGRTHCEIVEQQCGDFVLRRRDLLWSYQLAVVVDDAAAGITHIVRGDDLAGNTARQCLLQARLSLPRTSYLHVPVVRNPAGEKLSKQTNAPAVCMPRNDADRLAQLHQSMQHLGFSSCNAATLGSFWSEAVAQWTRRFVRNE